MKRRLALAALAMALASCAPEPPGRTLLLITVDTLRAVAEHPSRVYPGRDWLFWQYSGSGLSGGVDGKIDLNVFHGDEGTWRRWVGNVAG